MPKSTDICSVVVRNGEGKYLLVQEGKPSAYGLWNLPGGRVDESESLFDAAIREAHEETGFAVRLTSEIPIIDMLDAESNHHFHTYTAKIIGGKLTFDGVEILDAAWLSYEEIQKLNNSNKLRAPFVFNAVQQSKLHSNT